MGLRYVLQLLFGKNHKIANNSTTNKAREKNKHRFGILIDSFKAHLHVSPISHKACGFTKEKNISILSNVLA